MRIFSLLLLSFLSSSLLAQDCLNLPDTLFVCGFTDTLPSSNITGEWSYLCAESDGIIDMDLTPDNQTSITVNQCGTYYFAYTSTDPNCIEVDTVEIHFDDPSSVQNSIHVEAELEYSDGGCSGGSYNCGGFGGSTTISISGNTLPNIAWAYSVNGACSSTNFITDVINVDLENCEAEDILVATIEGSDADTLLLSASEDYVLEHFFDIYDSLFLEMSDSLDCALLNPGCAAVCYDTIDIVNNPDWEPFSYDTIEVIIPHRVGGQWHQIVSNNQYEALEDTSIINYQGIDYRLIIEPGSDYYGPDNIDFTLDEVFISNQDTSYFPPNYGFVQLELQWLDLFEYDTITQIRTIVNSPSICIGCGGTSTSSQIPGLSGFGIPSFPCGPIILTWEFDYCVCNPASIEAFVDGDINCANPCADVYFNASSSGGPINQGACIIIGPIGDLTTILPGDVFQACYEGSYQVEYWDDFGCSATTSFTVFGDFEEFESSFAAEVCEGECYTWNGQDYCAPGSYEQTFSALQNGCDSIITLILNLKPFIQEFINQEVCPGETWNGYPAGVYEEYTIDSDFCIITTIEITETDISETFETIPLCSGECIDWNGMLICQSGNYQAQLSENGCTTNANLEVLEIFPEPINLSYSNEIDCDNPTAIIQSNGNAIDISWSNGENTPSIEVSSGGTYTAFATNEFGCISEESITITENFEGTTEIISQNLCQGECFNIDGVDYCETGVYPSISLDQSGCENTILYEVFVDNYVPSSIVVSGQLGCGDTLITLSVPDTNLEYIWSDGQTSNSIEVSQPGNYSLIVITDNGCSYMELATVNESTETGQVFEEFYTLCPGECIDDNFGNLICEPGTYTSEVINNSGCEDIFILNVEAISAEINVEGSLPSLSCDNSSVSLSNITTTSENAIFTYFEIIFPNGNVEVFDTELPELEITLAGMYEIIGYYSSNGNACETSISFNIEENTTAFEINVANLTIDCITGIANPIIENAITGNYSYTWEGPSISIDNMNLEQPNINQEGVYSLTLTNNETNCQSLTSFEVYPAPSITFETQSEAACADDNNGVITISNVIYGASPFVYSINNEDWQTAERFENLSAGEYLVVIQDDNGCEAEILETVEEILEIPEFDVTEFHICGGSDFELNATIDNESEYNYLWLNGDENPILTVNKEGFYNIEISNECYTTMQTFTVWDDQKSPEKFVFLPTAFSPFGQEENRIFKGYFSKEITNYSLQVFDRWGNNVFSNQDSELGWNGENHEGKMLNSGIYVWIMKGKMENCTGNMEDVEFSGDVLLVK